MKLFGGSAKSNRELVREQKKLVDRSIRELEREKRGLEQTEKRLIGDLKKAAKNGKNMQSINTMAKDLVRVRKSQTKFSGMAAELRGVSSQMTEMRSTMALQQSMKNVTKAMASMNKKANLESMQKILMEFQKQTDKLEANREVMSDVLDERFEEEDEEEQQDIINQVLDEIGIHLSQELAQPSKKQVNSRRQEDVDQNIDDDLLGQRLENLRRL
eukprot:TRINITY_DN21590_c0_g2_i3.p2 TRINITY_DN21590_c0_g2~~TRINITY_DN21590_c0_g2_i3.p2  ORF type:complete len:215 (-),score=74.25 TRINITY_DN21590_c0_g2_i3:31-675(-)